MHMFITNTMEKLSFVSKRHNEPDEFDFKEWTLKAKISRENTNSRRFSASNLKSFRENEKSFRSHITISSTVSSPGYTIRDEINPSTYSFTTALKDIKTCTTKDVGTQSTPIDISLSSPSPAPTPTPSNSRPIKQSEAETEDSPVPTEKLISEAKPIEVKDNKKKQQYTKRNEGRERNKVMKMMMCSHGGEDRCWVLGFIIVGPERANMDGIVGSRRTIFKESQVQAYSVGEGNLACIGGPSSGPSTALAKVLFFSIDQVARRLLEINQVAATQFEVIKVADLVSERYIEFLSKRREKILKNNMKERNMPPRALDFDSGSIKSKKKNKEVDRGEQTKDGLTPPLAPPLGGLTIQYLAGTLPPSPKKQKEKEPEEEQQMKTPEVIAQKVMCIGTKKWRELPKDKPCQINKGFLEGLMEFIPLEKRKI
ncbi:hypothetical protein PHJA_000585900 [Phtheirospermum japonicum]|uniref:Uncharacterized protein n=1 Tax=Phtheirospermum japonicum TaxID=374723 RepID=A0A830BQW9_9LAMI|nr:hypothetical protein PHJA_000585900 [Phtheirospermum japonicum]